MNPLQLTLRNTATFDNIEFAIPEGLTALIGQNGAGKSTLINAIDIALFGPEGRTLAPLYPHGSLSDDPLQITLVFEHADETYRVRRSFSPKGRGASKTDLERLVARGREGTYELSHGYEPLTVESQKATGSEIETLIGLSRDTFRSSSFLAQGETGRFCDAQPRERKAILAEIMGLSDWVQHLERARVAKRDVERELDQTAGRVAQAEQELQERSLLEQERDEALAAHKQTGAALEETLSALATGRRTLAEQQARGERRRVAEKAVQDAGAALADLQHSVAEAERAITEADERLKNRSKMERMVELLPALLEEQETLQAAINLWEERQRLEQQIRETQATAKQERVKASDLQAKGIDVLEHVGDRHCDRCQQTLGAEAAERAAESYRAEATELLRMARDREARIETWEAVLKDMPAEEPDRNRFSKLPEMIQARRYAESMLPVLAEVATQRERTVADLASMREALPQREQKLKDATAALAALGPAGDSDDHEAIVRRLESEETTIRLRVEDAKTKAAVAVTQLERLDKIANDLGEMADRVTELQQQLVLLINLEKACGPNGVPTLILENVAIPQIETEASRILSRLGGPAYAVELRTLAEKKDGGVKDAMNIVCLTHDGDRPYETFSGGERARIAFALRLSLAQLLASRKASATGLLVIDEVEGLDPSGIAALVGVLEDLQASVARIIVVSHQAELRDAFAQSITVENVDGRSRIVSEAA